MTAKALRLSGLAPGDVPVIETERLRLRALGPDDLDALVTMWANPAHYRFVGNKPRDRTMLWQQILRTAGSWAVLGYGFWAIEQKASGTLVGEAGFLESLRNLVPSHAGTPEAGWSFAEETWGKGYATEAMTAAHAWSDARFPGARTVCMIDHGNDASVRVASKLGYRYLYDGDLEGDAVQVFGRTGQTLTE